jgi:hypothetical protein
MLRLSTHLLQPFNGLPIHRGMRDWHTHVQLQDDLVESTCGLTLATTRSIGLIFFMQINFDWVVRLFDIVFISIGL